MSGLILYSIGSKNLPAAELTLLSLTEIIGGIFWVWLPIFGINESPSANTIQVHNKRKQNTPNQNKTNTHTNTRITNQTNKHTCIHTNTQPNKQTNKQTIQTNKYSNKQTNKQINN